MIIYKITNIINNKIYIGLTINTLDNRLTQHRYEAKHGTDRPLYRAMRKYGDKAFKAEIIDTANNLKELKEKEQYWIKYYNSYGANGNGYNATKGGDVKTHPSESYLQVSLKDAHIIERFESARDCNKKLGGSTTQKADKITMTQYNNWVVVKEKNILNLSTQEFQTYIYNLRPKIICQMDMQNNIINRWINSTEILKENPNYTKSDIFACLRGERKTHQGYQWKYYKDIREDE